MELSSPRFKALAITAGFSFWFFIITNAIGQFSIELTISFIIILGLFTQIFAKRLSKVLNSFAIFNTKVFLGISFIFLISFYGLTFRLLHIDLLRLKKHKNSYWLQMEQLKERRIYKQY
tara:strand:+ start:134 stop:490 length:357 start_codon:yes stop_codon:yes gene_type:complete